MANSPVSCAGDEGSSPSPATTYRYAYRNTRTGLWWVGLKQDDSEHLKYAALFPSSEYARKLHANLWYQPVKMIVTVQEAPTGDHLETGDRHDV